MSYEVLEAEAAPRQAHCPSCKWEGGLGDCDQFQAQEDAESNPYMIAVCPICDSDEVQAK